MEKLTGRTIAILVEDGFEQVELVEPRKALDQAGAKTQIVSPRRQQVRAWNFTEWGDTLPVDMPLDDADVDNFDALLLPGGVLNPDALRIQPKCGGVCESLLRCEQTRSGDLPWSVDDHRGRRCARQADRFLAFTQD